MFCLRKITTVLVFIVPLLITSLLAEADVAKVSLEDQLRTFHKGSDIPAFGAAVIDVSAQSEEIAVSGVRKFGGVSLVHKSDKWHLGSITKSMTAVIVAVLVDQKLLSWSTTIGDVFTGFTIDKKYQGLPVTRLLTHTTGIEDQKIWTDQKLVGRVLNPKNSIPQMRAMLAELVLAKAPTLPQSESHYSNVGLIIVGAMLEKLTGQQWEDLVRQYLFKPLQMTSCGFGPTTLNKSIPADQPWGHRRTKDGTIKAITPGPKADNPPAVGPAGTVHCSLADVAKYARFHLDNLNHRETFLTLSTSKRLYEDVHGVGYSAGALILENQKWANGPVVWHNGSNNLNYAIMKLAPKLDKAFIATTNFGNSPEAGLKIKKLVELIRSL